ncbi:hypothetical protein M422DRAFT_239061 [Sphaerobolus stellatus SS14]|nr:hypothetical protein M422DRAFT_239061 [Sphaerobolus stellatus SS14]
MLSYNIRLSDTTPGVVNNVYITKTGAAPEARLESQQTAGMFIMTDAELSRTLALFPNLHRTPYEISSANKRYRVAEGAQIHIHSATNMFIMTDTELSRALVIMKQAWAPGTRIAKSGAEKGGDEEHDV